MTLDQWKTANPYDNEKENECGFCGVPCIGSFCSEDCEKADILGN